MIIVDTAIAKRLQEDRPIRLAIVGAGYSAKHIASQILSAFPAIHLAVVVNRTPDNARAILTQAGAGDIRQVHSAEALAGPSRTAPRP